MPNLTSANAQVTLESTEIRERFARRVSFDPRITNRLSFTEGTGAGEALYLLYQQFTVTDESSTPGESPTGWRRPWSQSLELASGISRAMMFSVPQGQPTATLYINATSSLMPFTGFALQSPGGAVLFARSDAGYWGTDEFDFTTQNVTSTASILLDVWILLCDYPQ